MISKVRNVSKKPGPVQGHGHHDLNGNLTNDGTFTYTYNPRNQLTLVKQGNQTRGSYLYDGLGRRVSRTVGNSTTKPAYDGWNLAQERASNGSVTANYLTGLGLDQPFIRTPSSGSARYYLSDALGSIVGLASPTGTVPTTYTYEPYGKTTVSGTNSASFLGFTGRENDSTGTLSLYNYRARGYSPVLHRFLTEDPIGLIGGVNLYGYVEGGPTYLIDPLGLDGNGCGFLGIGCIDARELVILGYDALAIAFSVAAVLSPQFAVAYFGLATIASLSAYALSIEKTFLLEKQPWNAQTQFATGLGFNNVVTPNVVYRFNQNLGLRSSVFFDVVQLVFDWASFSQR